MKTCVGSEWCRFGAQDSHAAWAWSSSARCGRMYAPHKVKLAVSGCPRNCAESGHQGRRRDRRRFGLGDLRRRQRRHQDRSRAVPRQGQNRARKCSNTPARSCSSIARKAWYLERTVHYVAPRRARLHPKKRVRRRRRQAARRCTSGCSSRSTASPIRGRARRRARSEREFAAAQAVKPCRADSAEA